MQKAMIVAVSFLFIDTVFSIGNDIWRDQSAKPRNDAEVFQLLVRSLALVVSFVVLLVWLCE